MKMMLLPADTTKPERVERLLVAILSPIRAQLGDGPQTKVRVDETLVALALATDVVLRGSGYHPEAVNFFYQTLKAEINN